MFNFYFDIKLQKIKSKLKNILLTMKLNNLKYMILDTRIYIILCNKVI